MEEDTVSFGWKEENRLSKRTILMFCVPILFFLFFLSDFLSDCDVTFDESYSLVTYVSSCHAFHCFPLYPFVSMTISIAIHSAFCCYATTSPCR